MELTRFRRWYRGRRESENSNAINPFSIRAGVPATNHRNGTSGPQHQRAGASVGTVVGTRELSHVCLSQTIRGLQGGENCCTFQGTACGGELVWQFMPGRWMR